MSPLFFLGLVLYISGLPEAALLCFGLNLFIVYGQRNDND